MLTQCIRGGDEGRRPGWVLRFHYDPDTIEKLKTCVPHTQREWRADKTEWWVSENYEYILMELFSNFDALAHQQMPMF